MFDPITTDLIRNAPAFAGLDLEQLPKRLTEDFAAIVSARIRLRGGPSPDPVALPSTVAELRRIAAAQEAYAALLPDRQNRAAAAFVAAVAHQTMSLASRQTSVGSRVEAATVSSDICATLLFLLAEAHADAAEAAKGIAPHPEATETERALVVAIRNLAQGRLTEVVRHRPPVLNPEVEPLQLALDALRSMLLRGVISLGRRLRSRRDNPDETVSPPSIFVQVKSLCAEPIEGVAEGGASIFSLFPGPLHLANLLLGLESNLISTALNRIKTPGGVAEEQWAPILRRMSYQRPFLWRNHCRAIESGYLEQGKSSAISFPTGAGKSTLAELKIATALLRDEQVVFLAPTHALVGQTQRALQKTFRNFSVLADLDEDVSALDDVVLGEVTVMTPERCLMLLSVQPEAFESVGLIVFDECHLLHPREDDRSRRGLDSMLAVLNLTHVAPAADLLLLSAMMKNTAEIAGWVEHLTGRACLPLDLSWKPTRQTRGCVVYPADQITSLKTKLGEARADAPPGQRSVPAQVVRELLATPYGLFSLLQTWSTTDRADYALLQLLPDAQPLSATSSRSGDWYLTPNGNETSSNIAAAAVTAGMKTLVFVQSTIFSESCVTKFKPRIPSSSVSLNDDEKKWHALAAEELGRAEYCFLKLDDDGVLRTGAVSHHALLLREERELHESLFRRRDGVGVLFATSTLAQGMNLPSELVIISGDSRFDPGGDRMKKLEAHELLNAAGRAGRAGEGAQGFVLLVPSKVIDFDDQNSQISGHWMELQAIFEQADQCLTIDDPLEEVLDKIHAGTVSGTAGYLLGKLPLSAADGGEDPAETMLRRSLASYRAVRNGRSEWIETRIAAALSHRPAAILVDEDRWIEQVASSTGLRTNLLQELIEKVDSRAFDGDAPHAVQVLTAWLEAKPWLIFEFIRPQNVEGLLGEDYKKLANDEARGASVLQVLKRLLPLWMAGEPLFRLEAEYLSRTTRLGQCRKARFFVSRIVPDFAFLAGLPGLLLSARRKSSGDETPPPILLATLGKVVRAGCDSAEALAMKLHCGRDVSRVAARRRYEMIKHLIQAGTEFETFDGTLERVRNADLASKFDIS